MPNNTLVAPGINNIVSSSWDLSVRTWDENTSGSYFPKKRDFMWGLRSTVLEHTSRPRASSTHLFAPFCPQRAEKNIFERFGPETQTECSNRPENMRNRFLTFFYFDIDIHFFFSESIFSSKKIILKMNIGENRGCRRLK